MPICKKIFFFPGFPETYGYAPIHSSNFLDLPLCFYFKDEVRLRQKGFLAGEVVPSMLLLRSKLYQEVCRL